jgi:hypothetical protein
VFGSGSAAHAGPSAEASRYLLWIDRVGQFLLCLSDQVTIGGPGREGNSADISLFANLSRKHATLERGREGYIIEAHGAVKVAGRSVDDRANLNNNYEIELGNSVKLKFRLPTALSASATLGFVSDHRPARSVDGVVLMDETCLLGPGPENHIRCPLWTESIVLYRKDGQFYCRSRCDLFVNGDIVRGAAALKSGDVVTGAELRFRLEAERAA